ncbi:MAG: hypothetical protein C4542_07285 [Dehalococcoidia bacterium]|nr:MAG: hypothetical protein C4542_07285 [Dehalococcoidia bacterium]
MLQPNETRELKCVLTDEEMKNYSMALARKQQDLAQAELEKKAAASYHKERMERLTSEINTVSRNVVNGYEFRQVECYWDYLWNDGVKRLYRTDTGEMVDSKPINEYERQQHLKLEEKEDGEEFEEAQQEEKTEQSASQEEQGQSEEQEGEPEEDPTMPEPTKQGRKRRSEARA